MRECANSSPNLIEHNYKTLDTEPLLKLNNRQSYLLVL